MIWYNYSGRYVLAVSILEAKKRCFNILGFRRKGGLYDKKAGSTRDR